jgi:glycosyltransferase involved in cell wall biosynthesis
MKVFFDHQIFLTQKVGGVSRYFYSLKKALVENELCEVDNWAFIYRNTYIGRGNGAFYLNNTGIKKIDKLIGTATGLRYLGMINEKVALRRFQRMDCNLIHATADDAAYISKSAVKKPLVVTVHDLIPELYPSHFYDIKTWLKMRHETFKMADHLICISESTRRDLKAIYGFGDDKISMVYHGPADYMNKGRQHMLANPGTGKRQKYLLYVGDRKTPYKNFWGMMENLRSYIGNREELKLVCVGAEFTGQEKSSFVKLGVADAVLSVQAREDELFSIYQNAECLILPSIYEGFGFPLLEAMKAGCPILSGNSSSLPEVGGDGALYFNPVTFDGFATQLDTLLHNEAVQAQIKLNQTGRLEKFSWRKTAEQTCAVYKSLAAA